MYILLYGLFVANNSRIYFKITKSESMAFKYIFIILLITIVVFIYLNYLSYNDLGISFDALKKCNNNYNELYHSCKNISSNITSTNITTIAESLNISIPSNFGK